jgi:hypothetical protein
MMGRVNKSVSWIDSNSNTRTVRVATTPARDKVNVDALSGCNDVPVEAVWEIIEALTAAVEEIQSRKVSVVLETTRGNVDSVRNVFPELEFTEVDPETHSYIEKQ